MANSTSVPTTHTHTHTRGENYDYPHLQVIMMEAQGVLPTFDSKASERQRQG